MTDRARLIRHSQARPGYLRTGHLRTGRRSADGRDMPGHDGEKVPVTAILMAVGACSAMATRT
jgi:hypothetical protein